MSDPLAGVLAALPNLDEIEAGYAEAVTLYASAFDQIAAAAEAIRLAAAAVERVTPGAQFHAPSDAREVSEFHHAVQLPDRDLYLRVARRLTNLRCWQYVVDRCGLRQLMDAQARRTFDEQLRYVPERPDRYGAVITGAEADRGAPEFSAETVRSTLAHFAGNAATIWRRGIANAFSGLDRRFRSHDGFKVGSRVILTRLVDHMGFISHHGSTADTLADIERTLLILDGADPRRAQSNLLHVVQTERPGCRVEQSVHETPYLRVRIFQNGNAHLWFRRDDLVQRVNGELAAYYGEVLGDGQTVDPDPLRSRAVTHARLYGFYPTPVPLAEKIARLCCYSERPLRLLEPSAGTGNLAFALAQPWKWSDKSVRHRVEAIELQPALATALRESGRLARVVAADFLQVRPDPGALYDGVVMNPPFDLERDIDHVTHALSFVREGGFLLSVMSAGIEWRESRKAAAFRNLLESRGGWMLDLPAGSFSDVGTHVNTVLVGFGLRRPYYLE